jgi:hypothetical protein
VGFPIRKSADQSLSQRSTSFIASQRQGIHRTPLRHLIALIINTHPDGNDRRRMTDTICRPSSVSRRQIGMTRKTSLSSDRSDGVRSSSRHIALRRFAPARQRQLAPRVCRWRFSRPQRAHAQCSEIAHRSRLASRSTLGAILPLHDVRYLQSEYARTTALSARGNAEMFSRRTSRHSRLVEPIGIEPTTSCLQSTRSPN